MIIPIFIDTTSLAEDFALTKENMEDFLDNVIKQVTVMWAENLEEKVRNELSGSSRGEYLKAIKAISTRKGQSEVMLDFNMSPMAEMLENGAPPFDMKPGFLGSPKVKITSKGAKYLDIPFRLGTPGVKNSSGLFSLVMPRSIYNVLRGKETNISIPGGKRSQGLTESEISRKFLPAQTRPRIVSNDGELVFEAYQHKTSLYQGAFKQTDEVTGQSSYHMFRRVSENSDPMSWIHKGIEAHNFFQKALDDSSFERYMGDAIDISLIKMGLADG